MPDNRTDSLKRETRNCVSQSPQKALERSDCEGGDGPDGPQEPKATSETQPSIAPYKSTSVFDENTLPAGFRREHRTKPGVWGIIRVLEGRLRYKVLEPASETILDPTHPGLVSPDVPHLVEPLGPMKLRLEFYDQPPDLTASAPPNQN